MNNKHLRYTVDVDGCPRKILSVSLQRTGLIFDLKPAGWHRPTLGLPATDGQVEYSRATFHHSPKSPTGNLITRTTSTSNGLNRQTQFTLALKTTNNFAKIISRRFPDMSRGWPEASSGPNDVSLGKLAPQFFSLVTCVFVGNKNKQFTLNDPVLEYGINVSEKIIENYKILILYSFYKQPSIDQGTSMFLWTTKSENIAPDDIRYNNIIMNGFDEYHVREQFFRAESLFRTDYLELTGRWMGDRMATGVPIS